MVLPSFTPHPLKQLLKREKISPFRVAKILGTSYPRLWEILSGIKEPSPEHAQKLDELSEAIEKGTLKIA